MTNVNLGLTSVNFPGIIILRLPVANTSAIGSGFKQAIPGAYRRYLVLALSAELDAPGPIERE